MISFIPVIVALIAHSSVPEHIAADVARHWIYTDFDMGGADVAIDNAVAAGRYAFPLYDELLIRTLRPRKLEAYRVFSILSSVDADCSRYVSVARKMAVGDGDIVRGSAIKFLARHGSKADIKLALTFMMTDDGTLGWACLDLLARLGGQDEVSLIGAAIVFPNSVWSDETKDYARKRLAELEKRLANESAKPILKSPVVPMPKK